MTISTKMDRNVALDYYKILLAFLVITIHIQPLAGIGSFGSWFISDGVARIGVPSFFIISGYFLYNKIDDWRAIKKYLIHLLCIYIAWEIIYLPNWWGRSIMLIDIFVGYFHLWFIPALFIGSLLLLVLKRFAKNDAIILLIGIALYVFAHTFLANHIGIQSTTKIFYFQNGIFAGFPLIALGYFIRAKDLVNKIKPQLLLLALIIAIPLFIFDIIYTHQHIHSTLFMLSLYVICPIGIMSVIKFVKIEYVNSTYNSYLSKLSGAIYFIQIYVIDDIVQKTINGNIYRYPIVVLISVLLGLIIILINKRIKILL